MSVDDEPLILQEGERVAGMSREDIKAKLDKLDETPTDEFPLFMTQLPDDPTSNPAIAALQALLYEGTPDEIALNFKNQGNQHYARGVHGFQDALKFYTKGIEAGATDDKLNATLHLNRAAVNVELQKWAEVLADTSRALQLDACGTTAIKGNQRKARAALKLGRAEAAQEAIAALRALGQPVEALEADLGILVAAQQAALKRQKQLEREKDQIQSLVRPRGIAIKEGAERDLLAHFGVQVDPLTLPRVQPDPHTRRLLWPILLLYPAVAQSDMLSAVDEGCTMADLLATVFAETPEWDRAEREYAANLGQLQMFYARTEGDVIYRMRPTTRVGDLVGRQVRHIERGIIALYVFPPGCPDCSAFAARFAHMEEL